MPALRWSGDRLRTAREAAGLRREAVGLATRRSSQSVLLWERGHHAPPLSVVLQLAQVLDCEPERFFVSEAD